MKSLCVYANAQGHLRVVLTRHKDLVRHDTSTPDNPVYLIWTFLAPAAVPARSLRDHVEVSVSPRFAGQIAPHRIPNRFYAAMILAVSVCPLVMCLCTRVRSRSRKPFARLWFRMGGGAR